MSVWDGITHDQAFKSGYESGVRDNIDDIDIVLVELRAKCRLFCPGAPLPENCPNGCGRALAALNRVRDSLVARV